MITTTRMKTGERLPTIQQQKMPLQSQTSRSLFPIASGDLSFFIKGDSTNCRHRDVKVAG